MIKNGPGVPKKPEVFRVRRVVVTPNADGTPNVRQEWGWRARKPIRLGLWCSSPYTTEHDFREWRQALAWALEEPLPV